jgi:CheY-like chemotaxis protein
MNILIVEDDESKLARIVAVLHNLTGAEMPELKLTCSDCLVDARQQLADHEFDLMILDIRLPVRKNENPDDNAGMLLIDQLLKAYMRLLLINFID